MFHFAALLFPRPPSGEKAENPLTKITTYIDNSKIHQSMVWGTDKEITVAATFLQANIHIFSQFGRECKWVRFSPVFRNQTCTLPLSSVNLHLYHTGVHYDRVVPNLGGLTSAGIVTGEFPSCNCGSHGVSHGRTCPCNPRHRFQKNAN